MSEEEKKAINQLKADTSFYDYELKNGNYIYELFKIEVYKKDVDVILNLIEKQSKQIEELKEGFKIQEHNYQVAMKEIEQRQEDKIKAKIEELENLNQGATNNAYGYGIHWLQSLLEEKE